ncbi:MULTISPECIES: glutaredoxin family protein [Bacillales]|uniref:glutaredoxin family protein n=1 Tax=Bacillales TaxID=1385 RepID=UPI00203D5900|nr:MULTISPECIES: glutaredoxin family protein [Bacillales]MCM3636233.1 glutaredoxin family protein [Sporosarcina luteola]MCM3709492.1 glutaredoxin family protein [Sporosarcina luteola]
MTATATVYTTNTCPYCTMMKNYLDEQNIPYREVNVQEDEAAGRKLVETTGQMGVPQTELNGKWILGFDTAAVQAALKG